MRPTDRLHPGFAEPVRQRGWDVFRAGGVHDLELLVDEWSAAVASPLGHQAVSIAADEIHGSGRRRHGELRASCSCSAFEEQGRCEHLWAAICEIELFLDAASRFGEDARVMDLDPITGTPVAWITAEVRDAYARRRGLATAVRAPTGGRPSTAAAIPAWRLELRGIAGRAPARSTGHAGPTRELAYAVVMRAEGMEVQVVARRPGAGRRPTAWRRLHEARSTVTEDVRREDAQVLALLRGAVTAWHGDFLLRYESRYVVAMDAIDVVAPLLAATGRACAHDWRAHGRDGFDDAPPFSFEPGPPRRFEARLVRRGNALALEGEVVEAVGPGAPQPGDGLSYLLRDGRLTAVDVGPAGALAAQLLDRGPIHAEPDDADALLGELAKLPDSARVVTDLIRAADSPPRPRLQVDAPTHPRARALTASLGFRYDDAWVRAEDDRGLVQVDGGWRRRDYEREADATERLHELGGTRDRDGEWSLPRAQVHAILGTLLGDGWDVHAEGLPVRNDGTPRLSIASGLDWFELDGELAFGEASAPLPDVVAALRAGRRTVKLGDGSLGLLPENWLTTWEKAFGLGDAKGGDPVRFARSQAWVVDAMLATAQAELQADVGFTALRARLSNFERIEPAAAPAGFVGELRPYQREGLGWLQFLVDLGLGGCLADDMGLGKTVQVLALLLGRREHADGLPALVVAPRSLVFNWHREAARFAPSLQVLDFSGTDRWADLGVDDDTPDGDLALGFAPFDLVLTTYGTLRRDVARLRHVPFDHVVLDEAQAIKNAQSQIAKLVRLLHARNRLALSGTPVENHLDELWSIFEFLNPGMLGRSKAFRSFVASTSADGAPRVGPALRRAIRPFLLRRTKEEVLPDLPPKTEQVIEIELGKKQRRFYDRLRDHVRDTLLKRVDSVGIEESQIQILQALLRLRQAACHPGLVDGDHADDGSAKLEALLPMLDEVIEGGHKALVFSQFTSFLAHVRATLDARGIRYEYLDGRTRKRQERVDRFQDDGGCPLFLISLKAGGHGLNLTAADYVFLLDPWWNPAAESQAIDRAHRIGQSRKVVACRLIARETVEQKVLELQERKRELAASLFADGGGASVRDLTREDLEGLFA